MAAVDWTRIVDNILPNAGAEDVTRTRTGVVDGLNSDGTADVIISGLVVPNLPVLDGVNIDEGDTVLLISYRGQLIVQGRIRSSMGEDDTGWITLTRINGWNLQSNRTVMIRRIGNVVYLQGQVTGGSGPIANIPNPYNGLQMVPSQTHINPVYSSATGYWSVNASGTISTDQTSGVNLNGCWVAREV